jgi:chemotaxis protein methyltransferase CheR
MQTSPILTDSDYDLIAQIVYKHSRIHLGTGKRELVSSRLGKRLRTLGCESYAEYCGLLTRKGGDGEVAHLLDAISTNHTFFFRERQHFDFLEKRVLREFADDRAFRGDGCLRCWSAAASTGEEPYSIALLLASHADSNSGFRWEMDCTDISRPALETAKAGIYPAVRLGEVPQELRKRFFQKGVGAQSGHHRVKAEIRHKIMWHQLNLFQDTYPFEKKFHVIFCRNVMIYFDKPSQEQLIEKMANLLVPGGYLKVGHSESLSALAHRLDPVQPAVYRRPKP